MSKANVKLIATIVGVSLAVVIVYDFGKKKYNESKTTAPKTTA